jgi:hypothetical protein
VASVEDASKLRTGILLSNSEYKIAWDHGKEEDETHGLALTLHLPLFTEDLTNKQTFSHKA